MAQGDRFIDQVITEPEYMWISSEDKDSLFWMQNKIQNTILKKTAKILIIEHLEKLNQNLRNDKDRMHVVM